MKTRYIILLCAITFIVGLIIGNYNGALVPKVICKDQSYSCKLHIDTDLISAKVDRLNQSKSFNRFFSTSMTINQAMGIYGAFKPATTLVMKEQIKQVCKCVR